MPASQRSTLGRLACSMGIAGFALLNASCNLSDIGSVGSLNIAGGGLSGISISGDSVVTVGDTIRLKATGNVDGILGMFSYDPLADAHWATRNWKVAAIVPRKSGADELEMARALVRGTRPGSTRIVITARGLSTSWPIRVKERGR